MQLNKIGNYEQDILREKHTPKKQEINPCYTKTDLLGNVIGL